jgi:hypothetical protein
MLVAKYGWGRIDIVGGVLEVGIAGPGCVRSDHLFARYRSGDVDVFFTIESARAGVDDKCFHRLPSSTCSPLVIQW